MRKIHKYFINHDNVEVGISVPVGSRAISVDSQENVSCIYYQFDVVNEYTMEMRRVIAVWTGREARIGPYDVFVGTTTDSNGTVRHVFEL